MQAIREAVVDLARIQLLAIPQRQRPSLEELDEEIEKQSELLGSTWLRFFIKYDPSITLRKVRCPVLALIGSLDTQVPASPNAKATLLALRDAGNSDVTVEEVQGLNHFFQGAKTGSPLEYSQVGDAFAPRVMELISKWIYPRVRTADCERYHAP